MSNFTSFFPINNIPKTNFCNNKLIYFSTDINPPRNKDDTLKNVNYIFNEYGYRSEAFNRKEINVLTIGCSVTFGNGIPESTRFSNVFCNKYKEFFKKDVANWNFGFPGYSNDYIGRIITIIIPILKPDILITNFTSFARREFFDANGDYLDYRPDRNFHKLNYIHKSLFNNLSSLTSDYQDIYNFYTNYKLIEYLVKNYNIKWLFAVQNKDNYKFNTLKEHFNINIKCESLNKIDFARDNGHPGILSNYNHGINYFNKYIENYGK